MNKRQRKKWVMKNVLKFYDMVFEKIWLLFVAEAQEEKEC